MNDLCTPFVMETVVHSGQSAKTGIKFPKLQVFIILIYGLSPYIVCLFQGQNQSLGYFPSKIIYCESGQLVSSLLMVQLILIYAPFMFVLLGVRGTRVT